jgi:geranylgeranyl diphosphate synthase type I
MQLSSARPARDCVTPATPVAGDLPELHQIEALMRELCLGTRDHLLGRIAWEHVASGGKRLRARLGLLAVSAFGRRAAEGIAWGASCELLHNASLIHDDIQDGDQLRRGERALWARYGVAQAINAGDLCIALGYAAIDGVPASDAVKWQLTRIVAHASRLIVEGQAAEMSLLSAGVTTWPTWDEYASCVEGKTSALFSLPIEGAAIIAGKSLAEAAALADACRPLGLLFQIQDDVLDLFGQNGRDMPGSDLAQCGKASAFVVEQLRLHPDSAPWLMAIVMAPREETSRAAIDEVIARFAADGALAAVWQRMDDIADQLGRTLAGEPQLRALVDGVVATALRPIAHTRPRHA